MRSPHCAALHAALHATTLLGLLAPIPAQRATDSMTAHTFESEDHGDLAYRRFTPTIAEGSRLPLVVFLHGAGERGDDNKAQLRHGVRAFVADGAQKANPCFVVAPQCPRGVWWNIDALLGLIATEIAQPGIDPDRVYLTGLSMGGFATWQIIGRRPELFAAAVPVCGGGEPKQAAQMKVLPIWAFHGDADRTVRPEQSRGMIEAIRAIGGEPKYTEYPGVGHDSWTQTYADGEVHAWLFAQRRATPIAPISLTDGDRVVFFGDSITQAGATGKGYIRQFETDLSNRLPDQKIESIGAGISGNRVPDLLARVARDVLARQPTVVVIYIGINDVWHSQNGKGTSKEDYEAGLRSLVQQLTAAKARVLLCTPTVIGEKAAGTNPLDAMLDEYAAITRTVARTSAVPLLDLRRQFVDHLATANAENADRGVLTTDGVHLNDAGNRFVADRMLEALVR